LYVESQSLVLDDLSVKRDFIVIPGGLDLRLDELVAEGSECRNCDPTQIKKNKH